MYINFYQLFLFDRKVWKNLNLLPPDIVFNQLLILFNTCELCNL